VKKNGQRVGIEKIAAYPCSMSLDLTQLARARGADPDYPPQTLMASQRSVNPCWEDPVTMAVNAAAAMLDDQDRQAIEMLVVGTESSPDQGKPISTFIHRFLDVQPHCRNFECKHACYGGTAALMTAAHWVASGAAGDAKALVICTDQSRMHLGNPWEYVMGAGAVALLISNQPDVLEIELESSGYWTSEVGDTFRPTSREEAGNTENSVYCYLDALDGALTHFEQRAGGADLADRFARHIYHVPFGAMAYRAHRAFLRRTRRIGRAEFEDDFARRVRPSLTYVAQVGGTYTASTFYSLIGLVDSDDLSPGDRLAIFSYGSGSCAEIYSAVIGPHARERVSALDFQRQLDRRHALTVEQYEAVEGERTAYIDRPTYEPPLGALEPVYREHYAGKQRLVLRGLDGFFRQYGWS